MDFCNQGTSIYHRQLAIYIRQADGDLVRSIGPQHDTIKVAWSQIRSTVLAAGTGRNTAPGTLSTTRLSDQETGDFDIHELAMGSYVAGLACKSQGPPSLFDLFFSRLILTQMSLGTQHAATINETLVEPITDLFDRFLRYEAAKDEWLLQGRRCFASKIRFFTSRNVRLEFCLPAFPCKSSNPDKVTGTIPDRGEEMALRRLHKFVAEMEEIYQPGARVWVISDGHVFSDCIGVDDAVVDRYGASLRILNGAIASEYGGSERVCFRSLVDLFALDNGQSDVDVPDIEHHLATLRSEEAELCRRILMAGCQAYPGALRANIEGQDPAILGLYRGFSRFMLEDLSRHPLTAALSRSQGKKLAAKVSFEMIHRNQAYSNLVEMLFPDHIRLSIHAHTNAGPKFGIRLFDKSTTKTNIRLSGGEQMSTTDRLHIPTPWHNSVAVIEGDPTVHIVKSQVVHGWLTVKAHEGRYIEGKLDEGCGGYFYLQPEPELEPATSVETNRRLKFGLIMSAGEFIRLSALGLQAWFRSIFRLSRALWLWPKP